MTTTDTHAPTPDLGQVKTRQQATWASGDFSVVATRIVLPAEQLAESADLMAGSHVLDVATGSGNAAIAAARHNTSVVGVDYVPALLEVARARAAVEGLDVTFVEGDAEALPVDDDEFDAVLSIYGVMFAPDHQRAADELVRASRPGGTIALASWTPTGYIGDVFRVMGTHIPPPAGVAAPTLWGTEEHLRDLFGTHIADMRSSVRTCTFRDTSPEALVAFFRRWYGPTLKAFEALEPDGRSALTHDLVELARRWDGNGDGGPVTIRAEYLESVITTG